MTQQQNQITDADLQALLAQNPLAAEQLRRIMAERLVVELRAKLDERKNGSEAKEPSKVAEA